MQTPRKLWAKNLRWSIDCGIRACGPNEQLQRSLFGVNEPSGFGFKVSAKSGQINWDLLSFGKAGNKDVQISNGSDEYCWRYRADTILSTDGQTDRRTDGQTDKVIPVYPPFNFVEAGGIMIMTDAPPSPHFYSVKATTIHHRSVIRRDFPTRWTESCLALHCYLLPPVKVRTFYDKILTIIWY